MPVPQQLPDFFIVRLVPRKPGDGNLRGTYIGHTDNIRQYDIAGDYKEVYDATVWSKKLPADITIDFGQPPRISSVTPDGKINTHLGPAIGDFLILVQGSRSPSGDGTNARRGLIGIARVEDVHFYKNKNLNISLDPNNVSQIAWTTARCSLRLSVLAVTESFLITADQMRNSPYYVKSGLSTFEAALGIGSTSSSGNVTAFFPDAISNAERKQRVIHLLGLFAQYDPSFSVKLAGTEIANLVPKDIIAAQKVTVRIPSFIEDASSRNRLFFGSPGSGKSRAVKAITQGHRTYTTTFHPDYEYADFVGAYKPVEDEKNPGIITYRFEPSLFTDAYVDAWTNPATRVYLVIEEINRGNCAQIFGDLFQLLDRDASHYSDYILTASSSLAKHLERAFSASDYGKRLAELYKVKRGIDCPNPYGVLMLPPNLYLYATMNTSDQSLFPMDSAFKRRWDWEYVPIDYADADQFSIDLGHGYVYRWGRFIDCINQRILELTDSEDKQLGNRFINPADKVITLSTFKSKVLYYLWSEIYRNERDRTTSIFQYQPADAPDTVLFTFAQLYELNADGTGKDIIILPSFMRQLGLEPTPPAE